MTIQEFDVEPGVTKLLDLCEKDTILIDERTLNAFLVVAYRVSFYNICDTDDSVDVNVLCRITGTYYRKTFSFESRLGDICKIEKFKKFANEHVFQYVKLMFIERLVELGEYEI